MKTYHILALAFSILLSAVSCKKEDAPSPAEPSDEWLNSVWTNVQTEEFLRDNYKALELHNSIHFRTPDSCDLYTWEVLVAKDGTKYGDSPKTPTTYYYTRTENRFEIRMPDDDNPQVYTYIRGFQDSPKRLILIYSWNPDLPFIFKRS